MQGALHLTFEMRKIISFKPIQSLLHTRGANKTG